MNSLVVIVFLALCIIYYLWGRKRISQSRSEVKKEFSELETRYNLSEYKCYTYNHPEVWGEVSYSEYKDEIIRSAKWNFSATGTAWPQKAMTYCIKVDVDNKSIYLVLGCKTFNWDKLQHYNEWLESQKEMSERIAQYKAHNK